MENIYRQYFDAMPSYLTVQDRELNMLDANKQFKRDFGDIEGRCCYQVYKHRAEKCEVCPVERTFRDGLPHYSEELVTTLEGREVWVVVRTAPIKDENGNIVSVMEKSTDITEVKLLQNQLRESQEKYRLLFNEVPCYISIQDKNLKIVESNNLHRDAFGPSYGKKCYEVYKHRTTKCEPCHIEATFKDGQIHTTEGVVTNRQNERLNMMVSSAPIRNSNGEIDKVVEMSADITQIRQLQEKLTSVGLLIGTVSHGIKGLLNALDGGIYLVNSGLKKDDRSRIDQGWEITSRNIRRIRSMVMDILYYTKDRDPHWEEIPIKDLADEVNEMFADRADKQGFTFNLNLPQNVETFDADRHAVKSLLVNLLDNSLDACRIDKKKDTHTISMNIKEENNHILFEIADNGIGMDRETLEKATSMFFSSKGSGGTGLGLFIANKIVESHGGTMKIESEENKGCKFIVKMLKKRPQDF